MKLRRFITIGSILAMVLSLGMFAYIGWRWPHWGNRRPFSISAIWHMEGHGRGLAFYNGFRGPWAVFSNTLPCANCKRPHRERGCDGVERDHPRPPRLLYQRQFGAFDIRKMQDGRTTDWKFCCEDWFVISVLAAYPALYFLVVGVRRYRRRPGHCLHCDYDLTGNESGVCPECGTRMVQVGGK